jgi:hypothetical protein
MLKFNITKSLITYSWLIAIGCNNHKAGKSGILDYNVLQNYSNSDYACIHTSAGNDSVNYDTLLFINEYGNESKKTGACIFSKNLINIKEDSCCNTIIKQFEYDGAQWTVKSEDQLFCEQSFEYMLKDVNDDSYNDLLIRNTLGEGRNITYYLFLYSPENGTYIRIKDFESLPNVNIESGFVLSQAISGNNDVIKVYQIDLQKKNIKLYYKTGIPIETIDSLEREHILYLINKYTIN